MIKKSILGPVVMVSALMFATFAFSETRVLSAELLTVDDGGKLITFQDGDATIKSKVSGSRTEVVINGESADRENLKPGMTCDIEYSIGEKNEPVYLKCN